MSWTIWPDNIKISALSSDKSCLMLYSSLRLVWTKFSCRILLKRRKMIIKATAKASTEVSARTESVGKCKWRYSAPRSTYVNCRIRKWQRFFTIMPWFKTEDWTRVSTSVTPRPSSWLSWWTIAFWRWGTTKERGSRNETESREGLAYFIKFKN